MKKVQLLSLMGLALILTACGNQNPNPAAYNYGYGVNGVQTGFQNNGWNNGWNNNWNTGYSTGGYQSVQGNLFTQSVQVNAGDRIYVNTNGMQYGAMIRCDRKLIDTVQSKSGGIITNLSVSLNGAALAQGANGIYTMPAAGTLTIAADLSQLNGIRCGWGGNDRPYQVISYWVSGAPFQRVY